MLGTFWDPPYGNSEEKAIANFQLAKGAYFNLLTGAQIEPNIDRTLNGMLLALRIANRVGLKYLVTDQRMYPVYKNDFDRKSATKMVNDYKRLPSDLRSTLLGYNLCDEPHFEPDHMKRISDWKSFLEAADTERLVYYNLAGSYAPSYSWGGFRTGNGDHVLDVQERQEYESYLDFYIGKLHPEVVSFDHYPFFADGSIRRDYFYNLAIIRAKSGTTPFWAYPMTVGHLVYADPTEAQLNFMYFCPIAYGAKGLVVFCFWTPHDRIEYRESLIDDKGNPTIAYRIVKRLNFYITKVIAPVIMRAQNIGVFHASTFPQNQVYINDDLGLNQSTSSIHVDERFMVGMFRDSLFDYLFIVNKNLSPVYGSRISVKGRHQRISLAPRVVGFGEGSSPRFIEARPKLNIQKGFSVIELPELSGGEGRLLRISRK